MPANVETMFYVRVAPWHGLGTRVESALCSEDALAQSGLDWNVIQKPIMTSDYSPIPGYKANIRDSDDKVLGVVTDRYKVVQNHEAFAFTDALLGEGVKYETAGSLQEGRKIWLHQGLHAPYSGRVPKHPEYRFVLRQTHVVHHPCRRPGPEVGRGPQYPAAGGEVYGQTGHGVLPAVQN